MKAYRFCPDCGAELETRRIPAPDGPERRVCSACGFIQWGNSKPTSAGIVIGPDGRLLLGRRAIEPYRGWWDVPGGFLEAGEHPEDGVRRELREETGLEVVVVRLVGVYMDTYATTGDDTLNFYYLCRSDGAQAGKAEDDIETLAWFSPEALPEQIAFPSAQAALRDWREQEAVFRRPVEGFPGN